MLARGCTTHPAPITMVPSRRASAATKVSAPAVRVVGRRLVGERLAERGGEALVRWRCGWAWDCGRWCGLVWCEVLWVLG